MRKTSVMFAALLLAGMTLCAQAQNGPQHWGRLFALGGLSERGRVVGHLSELLLWRSNRAPTAADVRKQLHMQSRRTVIGNVAGLLLHTAPAGAGDMRPLRS